MSILDMDGLYEYLFEFQRKIDIVTKVSISKSKNMSKKPVTSKLKRKPISDFLIPTIIDKIGGQERAYDIYSRLLEDRIIFL